MLSDEGLHYMRSARDVSSMRLMYENKHLVDVAVSRDGNVIASAKRNGGWSRVHLYDAITHSQTIHLGDLRDGRIDRIIKECRFGFGNLTVTSCVSPGAMQLWDAISGVATCTVAVRDREKPCDAPLSGTGLLSISGHEKSTLLQCRTPSLLIPSPEEKQEHVQRDCVQCFAPGAFVVTAFDISVDGSELTTLESASSYKHPIRRVRSFKLSTGAELNRWSFRSLYPARNMVLGSDVAAGSGFVQAAVEVVGHTFRLTNDGFSVTEGLNLSAWPVIGKAINSKSIEFQVPPLSPEQCKERRVRTCVSIKLPRSFPREGESLTLEETSGKFKKRWGFAATKHRANDSGWILLQAPHINDRNVPAAGYRFRLNLCSDELDLSMTPPAPEKAESTIVLGKGFVILDVNKSAMNYTQGPIDVQADGCTVAVDDETRLRKWPPYSAAPDFEWMDHTNDGISVRDLQSANASTVFGTREGDIYLLKSDNTVEPVHTARRELSTGSTGEDIQRVTITPDATIASAGNLNGELLLFDLRSEKDKLIGRLSAHTGRISALAVTSDARFIASADHNNTLKLWRHRKGRLDKVFEIDRLANPAIDIKFTPDGQKLFYLCENERGLRIIDLKSLDEVFNDYGINE